VLPLAGEDSVAQEFLEQSGARGIKRDNVLSLLSVKAMEQGRDTEARKILKEIDEPAAAILGDTSWRGTKRLHGALVAAPPVMLERMEKEPPEAILRWHRERPNWDVLAPTGFKTIEASFKKTYDLMTHCIENEPGG
jgi:hypothetical protein